MKIFGVRNDEVRKKTRLGIPLIFGQDVIHGYQTVFPLPLAQACSWDLTSSLKKYVFYN